MLQLECANRTIDYALEGKIRCPLRSSEVITLPTFSCSSVIMPVFDMVLCFFASSIYFAGLKYDTWVFWKQGSLQLKCGLTTKKEKGRITEFERRYLSIYRYESSC
jgi:hypothetical protein